VLLTAGILTVRASQPAARIHSSLDSGQTFRVTGNTRAISSSSEDQGEVNPALPLPHMSLHFAMSAAQQADLTQLLQQQVTRKSAQYHKWLTPEEFGARFGMNSSDLQKVTAWLERQGFSNIEVARSRMFVSFSGSASQAKAAFQTSIHSYVKDGLTHYANVEDPSLPKALQGMVAGIRGLNDMHPKPHSRIRPHFTSSISGSHFLTPDDFATMYDLKTLYGSGIDGTGQKIAIPGQSDIALADIEAFRTAAGFTQNDPQVVLTGSDPGTTSSDQGESELDIEWAGGVAKNATIIFVNSTDVFTSVTYAVDNNLAPVMSITYGDCESDIGSAEISTLNAVFQQASAQGMTIVAASGDEGAADCETGTRATARTGPAADFPGTSPYVTSVGGTTLNEGTGSYWNTTNDAYGGSALSYIPEVAWNDSDSTEIAASGGGASIFFAKPSWQAGTGVPNDGFRDVPDVAFPASPNHDGYLTCTGGGTCSNGFRDSSSNLDVVGGTSAAAPSFAAMIALMNQKYGDIQGSVNPQLYTVASFSTDAFHDITSGNNIVPCRSGSTGCPSSLQFGFSAGPGYDQVTGLGSIDGNNLINEWTADFGIAINPAKLTVTHGTSGTVTVTVAKYGNFNGTVSFSCSVASNLANTTCSIPGTVTGAGTATLTVVAGASAATPLWRRFGTFPDTGKPWLAALGGLFVCGTAYWLGGKQRRLSVAIAGALSLMVVMASCGDGSSSTTSTVGTTAATLTLTTTPTTLTLAPGASGTVATVATPGGSFNSSVALSVSGAPTGVTATLASGTIAAPGSGSVAITIAASSSVVAGTYPLTITASGGGISTTSTVNLIISPAGVVTVTATSGTVSTSTAVAVTIN
jgi:subtilase family serine protease